MLALDIVSRIATGMGKPFEKHTRLFISPICTVLADQKANIRAAGLQTLTAIATACEGIDPMIGGLTTGLETANPLQKSALLQWIVDWFKERPPSSSMDLRQWAPTVVASLDDRSADVRKAAQGLLPSLILACGFDFIMQQTNSLKPASRTTAVPLIQAARPAAAESAPKPLTNSKAPISPEPAPPSPPPEQAVIPESKPVGKISGVRRKLPQSTSRPDSRAESVVEVPSRAPGIAKRPIPAGSALVKPTANVPSPQTPGLPFSNMNMDLKKTRLAKDPSRWVNEGGPTRKDLAEALQSQMEPHASKDLVARLFSHDHNAVNDHISGLTILADFYSGAIEADENIEKLCLANLDLPLKYVSIKVHEPQSNLVSKCLDVIEAILSFLRSVNYQLSDGEALCFVPTMVFKVHS